MFRTGFRADVRPDEPTSYTVQGDAYWSPGLGARRTFPVPDAHLRFETATGDDEASGGSLLGRVTHTPSATTSLALQAFYSRSDRARLGGLVLDRDIADVDLRGTTRWRSRHELGWGLGWRWTGDHTKPGRDFALDPAQRSSRLASAFVQNTFAVVPAHAWVMLGSKLTHSTYTGWEAQPSLRLWWTGGRHMAWGAVSQPIRHPTRVELDGFFILGIADTGLLGGGPASGTFVPVGVRGGNDLDSERLRSYELGYRARPWEAVTFDLALFHNDYTRLISADHVFGRFNNDGSGESRGVEVAISARPLAGWRLQAGYGFTEAHHEGPIITYEDRNAPKHIAVLRSGVDVTPRLEIDTAVYFMDELPISALSSSTRLDLGARWFATPRLEIAVWGQNLLEPGIVELSGEFPRSAFIEVVLRR
jgi:iron complex outermembrane receptor protein